MGRFINADYYVSTGQGILGNNMFAYCGNNPIIRSDSRGTAFETIFDIISLSASIVEVSINPQDPWAWAGLVGDVIDLIPFVTGVGEMTRVVKTTVKLVNKMDDVIDSAKALKRSVASSVGVYEVLYKSGKNYVGKGKFVRAIQSAIEHAKPNRMNNFLGDVVTSIRWKISSDDVMAFIEEYALQTIRGVNNESTYNKIWSPGKVFWKLK